MSRLTDPYRSITRTVETAWIPMSDGRRLAARLFLPKDPTPVPAVLEYIPYRRRDGTRLGDDAMHLWFAANGYAGVRVDISGTGDSDGHIGDEYVSREQDDALEIIEWLGSQDWCSGTVGMIGHSWGGFSGLQAAARRPPRLKGIVSIYSTDDRYECDAHFMGGCLTDSNMMWGHAFTGFSAQPPDPAIVGEDRWRDMWLERIEHHTLFPAKWLHHQRRDGFWKHGSICEDYSAIECPVLAVGGWLDGYTRTVFTLVENLKAPCKGLIGPWGHTMPHVGFPGPAMGFLEECKRWFDRWLKGIRNGVEDDPAMRLWLQDGIAPGPVLTERPGGWVSFSDWSADTVGREIFGLTAECGLAPGKRAAAAVGKVQEISILSPQTTGRAGQEWCPFGLGSISPEGSWDQREDDANSICFDTGPLERPLSIAGFGYATLRLRSDRPQAMVAVRLVDIAPDGSSTLVSFGLLNLSHRKGHAEPQHLTPGEFVTVTVELKPVAQRVSRGHNLRLAVSSSYWPMVWPSPEAVTLTIDPERSSLSLPLLPSETKTEPARFPVATHAPLGPSTVLTPERQERRFITDAVTLMTTLEIIDDTGIFRIEETGTETRLEMIRHLAVHRDDPTQARTETSFRQFFRRDDWDARLNSIITMTADRTHFHFTGHLEAFDGDTLLAQRDYRESIPRDHM